MMIFPDPLGARGLFIIQWSSEPHGTDVCVVGIGLAETKFNVPGQ